MSFFLSALSIHKAFDATPVLRGVDLHIPRARRCAYLAPAAAARPPSCASSPGWSNLTGVKSSGRQRHHPCPAHERDFGLMFQDFALFPHLSVADNIGFGLRMRKWPEAKIAGRVNKMLELVDLMGYGPRKVFELSGGQQQRVALARSLAPQPRLLMLDEPLGSLDRVLRDQLLTDLRQLLDRLHQTAIYVTHDQLEAFAIADRVILMNDGRVEQQGSPADLYLQPATTFAARFLGFKNVLSAEVTALSPVPLVSTAYGILDSRSPASSSPASATPSRWSSAQREHR